MTMLHDRTIAVVVPARNEAERIGRVLTRLPAFVDLAIVVDDGSTDETSSVATAAGSRVRVVSHPESRGVGAAIATGYRRALALRADAVAVMAGDDQMDPTDLEALLAPVLEDRAGYVKGNRFVHPERRAMPLARRAAGRFLGAATRLATGLAIDDPQCGYTAISADAIRALPLDDLWPRYGYPNDLLALLARAGVRVAEVPVRPVYAGEKSGIRPWHAVVVLGLLSRRVAQDRLGWRAALRAGAWPRTSRSLR